MLSYLDFASRIMFAFFMGSFIGLERQWRQRLAGLRTNALVAIGASLYTALSTLVAVDSSPTRIAAAVVSGVGFLGGGVILRDGFNVKGINTAATLWCSASIGVLCRAGFIFQAFIGMLVILCANIFLRKIKLNVNKELFKSEELILKYQLKIICSMEEEFNIRALLYNYFSDMGISIISLYNLHNLLTLNLTKIP